MSSHESIEHIFSSMLQKQSESKSKYPLMKISTLKKIDSSVNSNDKNLFLYNSLFITYIANISRTFILLNASQKTFFKTGKTWINKLNRILQIL